MAALKVLGFVFIVINWFIICPFCVYYSLLYLKKAAHHRVLQLRQSATIKMNLIIICYFLLFEQTITLCETFNIIPSIPSLVSLCITLPSYCLVFYSAIIRSWLLYYDQQIQSALLQNKYASDNHHHNAKNKHFAPQHADCAVFFSKHRHTLGNSKFLYSLLFIIYIVSIIALLICGYITIDNNPHSVNNRSSHILLAVVQLIIILTPAILSCSIMVVFYFNSSKSNSHKRYALQYLHISFSILQNLDKEILWILLWTIIACLFRIIIAVATNLIIMYVFEDGSTANQYQYIYSLWSYDTTQYTQVYIIYTVWVILSVFVVHLIQTRRTLCILSELNWFTTNDAIKSPPSQIHDLSKNSMSDDVHDISKGIKCTNTENTRIIHVSGGNSDEDQESVTLLPSSPKYLERNTKSNSKKWEYVHISTNEAEEEEQNVMDEEDESVPEITDHNAAADDDEHVIFPEVDWSQIAQDIKQDNEQTHSQQNSPKRWRKLNIFSKNKSKPIKENDDDDDDDDDDVNDTPMIQKTKTDHFKKSGLKLLSKFSKAKSDNRDIPKKEKLNVAQLEVPLKKILTMKEGYDAFMKHLRKEYSTENLSFLTEVVQFKHRFCMELLHDVQRIYHAQVIQSKTNTIDCDMQKDKIVRSTTEYRMYKHPSKQSMPQKTKLKATNRSTDVHSINDDAMICVINKMKKQLELEHHSRNIHVYEYTINYGWFLSLCEKIPLTEILTNEHWRSFYTKAHKLYKKYIEPGCDSEINISYQCRNCITKYFNNYPNGFCNKSINTPSKLYKSTSASSPSERDTFANEACSVDSYASHQQSQDDLSRLKRRGSVSSIVDEGFRLKKSRSFHNVFEADNLYLEEEDDEKERMYHDAQPQHKNPHKFKIKLHDISNTKNILDKLDEKVFLLQLFDDAAEEIYSVLKRDSLPRFYETDHYTKTFLTKYVQTEYNVIYTNNNDVVKDENDDVNIVFYYYCTCTKRTSSQPCCECKEKYLKREPFATKLKRMKRKGIKRKKPLWSTQKVCGKNNKKEEKYENLKIKITRQKAVDLHHWSTLTPKIQNNNGKLQQSSFSPISITRRTNKTMKNSAIGLHHSSSAHTATPTTTNRRINSFHAYHKTQTEVNWKLDTQMMDTTESGYYFDDILENIDDEQNVWEYDNKGVPIVRIINVNYVNSNTAANSIAVSASPSPKTPLFHRAYAGVYNTSHGFRTRSLNKQRD